VSHSLNLEKTVSIFRNKATSNFTTLSNNLIGNPQLSFKAKGILFYLLSNAESWKVYEQDIQNHAKDGRESIRTGVKELINAGYIHRRRIRDEQGRLRGYEYHVYSEPAETTGPKLTIVGKSDNGKSDTNKNKPNKRNLDDIHLNPTEQTKPDSQYMIDVYNQLIADNVIL